MCLLGTFCPHAFRSHVLYTGAMYIPENTLHQFIQAYEEEFGERLEMAEAREIASNMLELYMLLLSPTPSERKAMEEKEAEAA